MATREQVAIIGAGVAGAQCARRLQLGGVSAVLLDKGRGPGGRLSTRRVDTPFGEVRFDHGAQHFTARSAAFLDALEIWIRAGAAATWTPRRIGRPARDEQIYVGAPSMNAVVKAALEGLQVEFGAQVTGLEGKPGAWLVQLADGTSRGPFDTVVCAAPAEQQAQLLGRAAPDLAREARVCASHPCWALMALVDARAPASFDAGALEDDVLSWVAREASKPGRAPVGAPAPSTGPAVEAWVAHAAPAWSAQNLERDASEVAQELAARLAVVLEGRDVVWAQAHRWRYAQVATAAGAPFGWDPDLRIGAIGDWRLGARIEAAWTSGDALGQALVSS